jgi:hypothetical protein
VVQIFGRGIAAFLLLVGMILIALVPIAVYRAGEQFLSFIGFGLLFGLLFTAIGLFFLSPAEKRPL